MISGMIIMVCQKKKIILNQSELNKVEEKHVTSTDCCELCLIIPTFQYSTRLSEI